MKNAGKKLAVALLAMLGTASAFPALAQHVEILSTTRGVNTAATFEGLPDESDVSLIGAIRFVVNAFLAVVAIVAVIVIIIAGFRLIVSGGNEETLRAARQQILYAVIGIVIILLSAVVVNFVISLFPGAG